MERMVSALVLMPVFATDILGGGPHTLGFLMGAAGMGALTGALFLASRIRVRGLERIILGGSAIFGAAPKPPSLFSDELVSDKSLDEVILSYLAEDLEPPRRK